MSWLASCKIFRQNDVRSPYVNLKVEGVETMFLVDSGSFMTFLDDQLVEKLDLQDRIWGEKGEEFALVRFTVGRYRFPAYVGVRRTVQANNLGMDVLRSHSCIIDLKADTLFFRKFREIPLIQSVINCKIAGQPVKVLVDTGASGFACGSMADAQRLGLPLVDITAQKRCVHIGEFNRSAMLEYAAERVSVRIFGKDFTGEFVVYPKENCTLIIGMDILDGSRITLPYDGGVVVNTPRRQTAVVPENPTCEDTFPTLQSSGRSKQAQHGAKSASARQPVLQQ